MANLFSRIAGWGKEHAPEILLGTGIAAGIATVVLACVETTKAGDILDKHKEEMDKIEEAKKVAKEGEYTEKDIKKDKMIVFRDTTVGMAKLYWPAALTGVASITCILSGHKILAARYGAATAALSLTQTLFGKYRERVVEDQGIEKDRQYYYGSKIEKKAIEEEVVDPDTGKTKKVKNDAEYIDIDLDLCTGAVRVFAEYNSDGSRNYEWDENVDICLAQLRARQQYLNDQLRAKGFIFLNEAFVECGLNKTQVGQVLGWKWEEGKYIDFGLGDYSDPQVRRFINGRSDCLILHFNVDGEYSPEGNLIEAEPIIGYLKEN